MHISYKEKLVNSTKNKVLQTYKTQWINYNEIELDISGLNLDNVFNNFIKKIAEDKFKNITSDNAKISTLVEKSVSIEKLEKQIQTLTNKMLKEKQFNKQLSLKKDLKALKQKMEKIKNG